MTSGASVPGERGSCTVDVPGHFDMQLTWMALGWAAVLAVAAVACGDAGTCTTEARASLTVKVMGIAGRICDADVVHSREPKPRR